MQEDCAECRRPRDHPLGGNAAVETLDENAPQGDARRREQDKARRDEVAERDGAVPGKDDQSDTHEPEQEPTRSDERQSLLGQEQPRESGRQYRVHPDENRRNPTRNASFADEQEGVVECDDEHRLDEERQVVSPRPREPVVDGEEGVDEHQQAGNVVAKRREEDGRHEVQPDFDCHEGRAPDGREEDEQGGIAVSTHTVSGVRWRRIGATVRTPRRVRRVPRGVRSCAAPSAGRR